MGKLGDTVARKLWIDGLSEPQRNALWQRCSDSHSASVAHASTGDLPERVRDTIVTCMKDELAAAFDQGLGEEPSFQMVGSVRRLLLRFAVTRKTEQYEDGSAILLSILLGAAHTDDDAAAAYLRLTELLQAATGEGGEALRQDIVVMASLLETHAPALCAHLNAAGVDLIDLHNIVSLWIARCFAGFLAPAGVLRMVDLALVDGVDALVGYALGALIVKADYIMQQPLEDAFKTVSSLPCSLSADDLHQSLDTAYRLWGSAPAKASLSGMHRACKRAFPCGSLTLLIFHSYRCSQAAIVERGIRASRCHWVRLPRFMSMRVD